MCPVISRMLLCLPVVRLPQSHLLFTLSLFCFFFFHVMDSKSYDSFNKDFAVLNKNGLCVFECSLDGDKHDGVRCHVTCGDSSAETADKLMGFIFNISTKWDISLPVFSFPFQTAAVKAGFHYCSEVIQPTTRASSYSWTYNGFLLLN